MPITPESIAEQGLDLTGLQGGKTVEKQEAPKVESVTPATEQAATVIETKKPEAPEVKTEAPDYIPFLKEHFGTDKMEELEGIKARLSAHDQLAKDKEALSKKVADYDSLNISDYDRALIQARKKGVDLVKFEKIQKADPEKISDEEAIRLELEYKYPKLSPLHIAAKMKTDYLIGLSDTEQAELTEDEKLNAESRKQIASENSRDFIRSQKAKDMEAIKPVSPEEQQRPFNEWKKAIGEVAKSVSEIEVKTSIKGADDKVVEETFKYKTNGEIKDIADAVLFKYKDDKGAGYLINASLFKDEQHLLKTLATGLNADKILSSMATTIRSQVQETVEKKFDNKQPLVTEKVTTTGGKTYPTKEAAISGAVFDRA